MTRAARFEDLAISETGFVFDTVTGATYSVNPTGLFILRELTAGKELEDIEAGLRKAFDVAADEDLKRDLLEFVQMLKNNGLVREEPR